MSPTERAYLAGVIDSDGHIIFGNRRRNDVAMSTIALGVTNVDLPLMNWLKAKLGGSIAIQRGTLDPSIIKGKSYTRRATVYKWCIDGERAAIVIRGLLPYLIVKKEKAVALLDRWANSLLTMQRPKRREFHIRKQRSEMASLGWT